MDDSDPHDEIVHLEAQIEKLTATVEGCRKFALAARIAMAGGGIVIAATVFGVVGFDPRAILAALAALLGGIVLWGSNSSTGKEAAGELAKAEANRAALIGLIDLRVIAERKTLH
jgi:hypothetical protein